MAMSVAVVTDSTAYLPDSYATRYGIDVVPLTVVIDGVDGCDGVDVDAEALTAALKAKSKVTTSMATPEVMGKAYEKALDGGADAVVSVHLSSELSGTVDAARTAARTICADRGADVVHVVDSHTTVMGLGFAAIAAAEAGAGGLSASDVVSVAESTASRSRTFFVVETLDYLRRGGRIGAATALFGTALAMKPLLHISGGKIKPLEKVRTMSRALSRLVELAADEAGDEPVDLAVHHLAAPERAELLADRLRERIPSASECVVSELGAVIGAHTGPGVVGVVVQHRE